MEWERLLRQPELRLPGRDLRHRRIWILLSRRLLDRKNAAEIYDRPVHSIVSAVISIMLPRRLGLSERYRLLELLLDHL